MSDPNKKYYRSIPSRNYEKLEGDVSNILQGVKESRQWLVDWNNRRKATGRFDDLLQDIDYMNKRIANVPVIASSDYITSNGKFTAPEKNSLGVVKLNTDPLNMEAPSYAKDINNNITHEIAHAGSMYYTLEGKTIPSNLTVNEFASESVTAPVKKVNEILGGYLVPAGGNYDGTSAEIYARLLSMRKNANMLPELKYSYGDMKYWLKKFNLDFGKDKSESLMNDVAAIDNRNIVKALDGLKMGGYTEDSELLRKNKLRQYDPTGGYDVVNWILSNIFKNEAKGEENEFYKTYLGFSNKLPKMNPKAKTEWDDKIELEKVDKGEMKSDFYGTTPRMDLNIQAMADTLNMGKIYRNYDEYKAKHPNLPSKSVIEWNYKTGKLILENPGKWTLVKNALGIKTQYDKELNETNPLGMLEKFGAKWVPEEGVLYMHDTYDFSDLARFATGIPQRPKEMKIRGRINFDPNKGSFLLRDDLKNFNSGYAKPITE